MRIIVCVKQVYDPKTVKISRSREELDLRDAIVILNPPDKYALEAALRLREASSGEVIALMAGAESAEDVVREAVAMGADRGVVVGGSGPVGAGAVVTRLLATAVGKLAPVDLVLTGEIGQTDGTGSLAPRLAAALGWTVLLDVVQLSEVAGELSAVVRDGDAAWVAPLASPAVVAVTAGPERPRYPHPRRIANAWNAGLVEIWTPDALGVSGDALAPDTETGGLILGPERTRGQVIGGAAQEAARELAGILRGRRII